MNHEIVIEMNSTTINAETNNGQKPVNVSSSISSLSSDAPFCRICHDSEGVLITACRCRGSIQHVHDKCLIPWLVQSGNMRCELCDTEYALRVRQSRTWTKRMSQHDKAVSLVVLSCLVFFLSTTAWLFWSAFSPSNAQQRSNYLFIVCYVLYGFMDVFCIAVLEHETPYLRLMCLRWRLLRYDLYVVPITAHAAMTRPNLETSTPQSAAKANETQTAPTDSIPSEVVDPTMFSNGEF